MDAETLAIFQQEAEELTSSLEAGLMGLERAPDDMELVAGVFRDLHTLKGTGAMFGFTRLAQFVHHFEAAFDRVRSRKAVVTMGLVAVALKAHDLIVALLNDEDPDPQQEEELKAQLVKVTSAAEGELVPVAPDRSATKRKDAPEAWVLTYWLPQDFLTIGGNPVALLDELRELGGSETQVEVLTGRFPMFDQYRYDALYLGWKVQFPGHVSSDSIDDVFMFHRDQMEMELVPLFDGPDEPVHEDGLVAVGDDDADDTPDASDVDAKQRSQGPSAKQQMRVSTERLDDIMDQVGELVIAEARLSALAALSGDEALKSVAEDIQRLAQDLRDSTMSIRMTPLDSILGRFRRLARDLAEITGKEFEFVVTGEQTELDKSVIEKLSDPLVHLLRNAVDHGLETPQEREAAGKPPTGVVHLAARYSGADVLIQVTDDGRGLDPRKIKARAVERGLVEKDRSMTRSEVYQLLLEPGFSTAEQVTELSGRGVGADVVKTTVEGLRGAVEIESEFGQGTTFTLRLPLTLAIMDGLLTQVGDEKYTIPLAAVRQIIDLPESLEGSSEPSAVTEFRGELISVLRLRSIFGSQGEYDPFQKIVIVQVGDARYGLVVDRIVGSFQTVIKQLSPLHSHMKAFSGATILGDGTIALILDAGQLVSAQKSGFFASEDAA